METTGIVGIAVGLLAAVVLLPAVLLLCGHRQRDAPTPGIGPSMANRMGARPGAARMQMDPLLQPDWASKQEEFKAAQKQHMVVVMGSKQAGQGNGGGKDVLNLILRQPSTMADRYALPSHITKQLGQNSRRSMASGVVTPRQFSNSSQGGSSFQSRHEVAAGSGGTPLFERPSQQSPLARPDRAATAGSLDYSRSTVRASSIQLRTSGGGITPHELDLSGSAIGGGSTGGVGLRTAVGSRNGPASPGSGSIRGRSLQHNATSRLLISSHSLHAAAGGGGSNSRGGHADEIEALSDEDGGLKESPCDLALPAPSVPSQPPARRSPSGLAWAGLAAGGGGGGGPISGPSGHTGTSGVNPPMAGSGATRAGHPRVLALSPGVQQQSGSQAQQGPNARTLAASPRSYRPQSQTQADSQPDGVQAVEELVPGIDWAPLQRGDELVQHGGRGAVSQGPTRGRYSSSGGHMQPGGAASDHGGLAARPRQNLASPVQRKVPGRTISSVSAYAGGAGRSGGVAAPSPLARGYSSSMDQSGSQSGAARAGGGGVISGSGEVGHGLSRMASDDSAVAGVSGELPGSAASYGSTALPTPHRISGPGQQHGQPPGHSPLPRDGYGAAGTTLRGAARLSYGTAESAVAAAAAAPYATSVRASSHTTYGFAGDAVEEATRSRIANGSADGRRLMTPSWSGDISASHMLTDVEGASLGAAGTAATSPPVAVSRAARAQALLAQNRSNLSRLAIKAVGGLEE